MKNIYFSRLLILALLITTFSCDKDDDGPATPAPVANFSHAIDANNPLSVTFTNTSTNAESYSWDFGDGNTSTDANPTHVYEEGGTYSVTLTASREGLNDTETHQVTVTAPVGEDPDDEDPDDGDPDDEDPDDGEIELGENIIVNGELTSEEGWTITEMDAPATNTEFTEDGLIFSNITDQTDVAVWQAIEVEEGQTYQISANVSGNGTVDSWIQFMIGIDEPVDGETYWTDNFEAIDFLAMYSFEGDNVCGDEPFNGNIVDIACGGDYLDENGLITFEEGGTYYFVIKAGSWEGTLGDGVTVTDVSMRPVIADEE